MEGIRRPGLVSSGLMAAVLDDPPDDAPITGDPNDDDLGRLALVATRARRSSGVRDLLDASVSDPGRDPRRARSGSARRALIAQVLDRLDDVGANQAAGLQRGEQSVVVDGRHPCAPGPSGP